MRQILITFLLFYFFFQPCPIFAIDFLTSITQTYTLSATGAEVLEIINLTNLTDLIFPTGYTYLISSNQIDNLSVYDGDNQPVKFERQAIAGTLKLKLHFPNAVVGKDKQQTYRLEYFNPDVRLNQNFAQYTIPKTILMDPATNVTTNVLIKKEICPQPLVIPTSINATDNQSFVNLTYSQQPNNHSVNIICYPHRYLGITLEYYLENQTLTPVETQIALPPDTSYQRLLFDQIEPAPLRLTPDFDGNRIATYKLEPKQNIRVAVHARAVITNPQAYFHDQNPDSRVFTKSTPFWPTNNPQVKQEVKTLDSAKSIYFRVLAMANYNPDQIDTAKTRIGGSNLFISPNDFSSEDFVDAFITLSRAKGILSRRVIGFVETNNPHNQLFEYEDSNLHVYAEWYDPESKVWFQVDPYWQEINPTTDYFPISDLSRLTLVINGNSDSTPYPAGLYPSPDNKLTQIKVIDIEKFDFPEPKLTATVNSSLLNLFLPSRAELVIHNQSNYALYQPQITLVKNDSEETPINLHRLDLNSQSIIPINFSSNQKLSLKTNYGLTQVKTFTTLAAPKFTLAAILVATAGLLAVLARRLLVHRR